uniref:Uncharacterized protein n=1 Tax=Odontella aurita TaxID=265563 RepID=A0A7S4I1W9_9STRA|mmetsp:Transcript_18737/g.54095  ORF Transcript_18737/g.54095 Transcript_18737/m.54095 type:complete len:135 (+) Transcript_18737:361-765(+)
MYPIRASHFPAHYQNERAWCIGTTDLIRKRCRICPPPTQIQIICIHSKEANRYMSLIRETKPKRKPCSPTTLFHSHPSRRNNKTSHSPTATATAPPLPESNADLSRTSRDSPPHYFPPAAAAAAASVALFCCMA